jgi:hypothetical protein
MVREVSRFGRIGAPSSRTGGSAGRVAQLASARGDAVTAGGPVRWLAGSPGHKGRKHGPMKVPRGPGVPRETPAHKSTTKRPAEATARRSRPRRLRLRDGSPPGVIAPCYESAPSGASAAGDEREDREEETTEERTMRAVSRTGCGADAPARPLSGNPAQAKKHFPRPVRSEDSGPPTLWG